MLRFLCQKKSAINVSPAPKQIVQMIKCSYSAERACSVLALVKICPTYMPLPRKGTQALVVAHSPRKSQLMSMDDEEDSDSE